MSELVTLQMTHEQGSEPAQEQEHLVFRDVLVFALCILAFVFVAWAVERAFPEPVEHDEHDEREP